MENLKSEENQANSKSIILNYGLILGFVGILLNLVMYAMGSYLSPRWYIGLISAISVIVIIVFGIKKFKKENNDFLSWGHAVKIGVGISIIAALISIIYNYIFATFIEPDYMNQLMKVQTQKLVDQGLTEDQIEKANELSKKLSSPFLKASIGIIGYAVGGFIVSAIAGAVLKKSKEEQY